MYELAINHFLINPWKTNKKRMKNLIKNQETRIKQQETYYIICIMKIIINLLVLIYYGKKILLNKLFSQRN